MHIEKIKLLWIYLCHIVPQNIGVVLLKIILCPMYLFANPTDIQLAVDYLATRLMSLETIFITTVPNGLETPPLTSKSRH